MPFRRQSRSLPGGQFPEWVGLRRSPIRAGRCLTSVNTPNPRLLPEKKTRRHPPSRQVGAIGWSQNKTRRQKNRPLPDYAKRLVQKPQTDRRVIIALVQKCLTARGVGCETWEAEINERVAALYGLRGDAQHSPLDFRHLTVDLRFQGAEEKQRWTRRRRPPHARL